MSTHNTESLSTPSWRDFSRAHLQLDTTYRAFGREYDQDFEHLQRDAAAGVEEATKILAAFMKYRLTR